MILPPTPISPPQPRSEAGATPADLATQTHGEAIESLARAVAELRKRVESLEAREPGSGPSP